MKSFVHYFSAVQKRPPTIKYLKKILKYILLFVNYLSTTYPLIFVNSFQMINQIDKKWIGDERRGPNLELDWKNSLH